MITVNIYGLDQFVVADLSREMTPTLAQLYEVDQDEINFIATNNMVIHKGVDQTSWNVIMHVYAPLKVKVLQDDAAKVLLTSIGDLAIHKFLEFYYYSQDDRYELINKEYPRFIDESNEVLSEDSEYDEDRDEGEGEDEIFTGDIFHDFHDDGHHHEH